MVVAGCNDRPVRDADLAVPNTGGGFVNRRDVTFVMKCKSAIITAEEVTAETTQIAYFVIQIIVGGRISPSPLVRMNTNDGGGSCLVLVLLRIGWEWIGRGGGVDG